ncbi:DUF4249 domain-containing protein [Spirosoma utsteinense]|uniref:DUF4249 domain-containing protein n=1 Tax=Spirosoma utsteinense TaxID=2585773 RepID=A0ABR6W8S8_9BACT|nr:DUF4249 domain-containing protein [Spirosoma utsteinense]MBC3787296.1 hypothetical protein [Spirosoma utsteinense]MBC3792982.1 hypothetical protein [Spirosoma utsteinense]
MKTLILCLTLLMLVSGCAGLVQDVDPARLPKTDPQLVVHSYLSPQDTLLTVVVSRSRTSVGVLVDSTQFNPVSDARVTLSEGNNLVILRFNPQRALYQVDARLFTVKVDHTYTLSVELPDGQRATATTTVPGTVPTPEVLLDSVANPASLAGVDYFVQLRWQDTAGEVNFYQVAGDNEYGSLYRSYGDSVEVPYQAINGIAFQSYNESPFLTDANRDGQVINSPRGQLQIYATTNPPSVIPPFLLNVYLLSVNRAYYEYYEMILSQARNEDNPFAEPMLIRGNIQGALGCFGAYNGAKVSFRLR